jgi:uncharacterized protein (DUF983 family)
MAHLRGGGKKMVEPTPISSSFRGLCPRCGGRGLFAGWVRFAPRCSGCGLDYTAFNVGDGPAALLIMMVGGIVVTLAIITELEFRPPFRLHILMWLPLTIFLVVGALRLSKGLLLALEYRHGRGDIPPADGEP